MSEGDIKETSKNMATLGLTETGLPPRFAPRPGRLATLAACIQVTKRRESERRLRKAKSILPCFLSVLDIFSLLVLDNSERSEEAGVGTAVPLN